MGREGISRLRALIIDVDDTLVVTSIDWGRVRSRLREELGVEIPEKPLAEKIRLRIKSSSKLTKALKIIEEEEMLSAKAVRRDDELVALLNELRGRRVRIAIVTLRSRASAEEVLRRLGIYSLIDILVTREDSVSRAEQLKIAVSALGVKNDEVIFLGDTEIDEGSARLLGIKYRGVSKGPNARGVPQDLKRFLKHLIHSYP